MPQHARCCFRLVAVKGDAEEEGCSHVGPVYVQQVGLLGGGLEAQGHRGLAALRGGG